MFRTGNRDQSSNHVVSLLQRDRLWTGTTMTVEPRGRRIVIQVTAKLSGDPPNEARFEMIVQAKSTPLVIAHPTYHLLLVMASVERHSVVHTLNQNIAASVLLLSPN